MRYFFCSGCYSIVCLQQMFAIVILSFFFTLTDKINEVLYHNGFNIMGIDTLKRDIYIQDEKMLKLCNEFNGYHC